MTYEERVSDMIGLRVSSPVTSSVDHSAGRGVPGDYRGYVGTYIVCAGALPSHIAVDHAVDEEIQEGWK